MPLMYAVFTTERFADQLRILPRKDRSLVLEKAYEFLPSNPRPDGKTKDLIERTRATTRLHRLRAGDYRVFYTIEDGDALVTLQAVVRKDADIYDRAAGLDIGAEGKRGETVNFETVAIDSTTASWPVLSETDAEYRQRVNDLGESGADGNGGSAPSVLLPTRISEDLLDSLGVEDRYWGVLTVCATEDELLQAAAPPRAIERLLDVLYGNDIVPRPNERLLEADTADTLERLLDGDLPTVLLRLDPEQRKHAEWPITGSGPALLTGGPGSGKSVVAAYRVKSLIKMLQQRGVATPRILVTTYTNALCNATRQLLERLLGDDIRFVEIRTADNLVGEVLSSAGKRYNPKDDGVGNAAVQYGRARLERDGNEGASLAQSITRLSRDYLRQEIERYIVARNVQSLEAYLQIDRVGRAVPLQPTQRRAVWRVFEGYQDYLSQKGYHTYAQSRLQAMRLVESRRTGPIYDGVVIDEAQDLDPTVIRMLIARCVSPDRLFLTADSDQQIYGSGFSWKSIHEDLRVQGRTRSLSCCYRSTEEIAAAASSWFPDPRRPVVTYQRHGPRPLAVPVEASADAIQSIHDFIRTTSRALRITIGSCAVLTPANDVGHTVAQKLSRLGLPTVFASGSSLDLAGNAVKVLTFHSSKGLEFPVVSILDYDRDASGDDGKLTEERDERDAMGRRVRYVALTRAMQALAVFRVAPNGILPTGMTGGEWDQGTPADWSEWADATTRTASVGADGGT